MADETPRVDAKTGERLNKTVVDLLRSLVPLILIVLVIVWLKTSGGTQVQQVDPGPDVTAAARSASYQVLAPQGLPEGWRPTSSRLEKPTDSVTELEVGYLTPADKYARYRESDAGVQAFAAAQLAGAKKTGTTPVGTRTWDRYTTSTGELALLLPNAGKQPSVLVTGSAGESELAALAASLAPVS